MLQAVRYLYTNLAPYVVGIVMKPLAHLNIAPKNKKCSYIYNQLEWEPDSIKYYTINKMITCTGVLEGGGKVPRVVERDSERWGETEGGG